MKLTRCIPKIIEYRLVAEDGDKDKCRCAWADFTLEFEFRRLSIRSDSGNYSYSWGRSETQSLLNLLSSVSKEYLLSKISDNNVFDVRASKERLIESVRYNVESYGIDDVDDMVSQIHDIPNIISEERWLYTVRGLLPKMDWESIPVEKYYPYNAQVIAGFFITHVQPEIKKEFEKAKKYVCIEYTGDNETLALDEVRNSIKRVENVVLLSLDITDSKRACRNANGKEMAEEEFEALDPSSDEAWFDDYDFTMKAVLETDMSTSDLMDKLEDEGLSVSIWEE